MLILITGASRGIGLGLVKEMARIPGALVLAVSRNTSGLKKQSWPMNNVLPVQADVSTAAGITAVVNQVKRLQRPIHVLVNNAGVLVKKNFEAIKRADLEKSYEVNLFAPFLLIQKLLPVMDRNGAHVVNISSMGGVQGSAKFPGLSVYSSSKGALCTLTECLAEELRPLKISVNCLALGAVQTEMLSAAFPGYRAPLNPAEIAGFISQFAADGHRYFNGKILSVSLSTP